MLRQCHITGESGEETQMLRFVAAPDGALTPDLAGKLPDGGQPFYVLAQRILVTRLAEEAGQDGAALAALVASLMRRQALALLGLARKAGALVLGFSKVDAALSRGELRLLLAAHDGAANGRKAMAAKAHALQVQICSVFGRDELGMALGRANVIHAGLTDAVWAARIKEQALRLSTYDGDVIKTEQTADRSNER